MLTLFTHSRKIEGFDPDALADLTEGLNGSAIYDYCQQLIKASILEKEKDTSHRPFVVLMAYLGKNGTNRKEIYKMSRYLHDKGYKLKELEKISKIPYTTLREHVN